MGKYSTLSALLSAIADAIRSKTGGKAPLPPRISRRPSVASSPAAEWIPATPRPRRATSWRA